MKSLVSLFSGGGGLDIGFEGAFETLDSFINKKTSHNFVSKSYGYKVILKKTSFNTIFANDIVNIRGVAWNRFFQKNYDKSDIYHVSSIVDLVQQYYNDCFEFPKNVDVLIGGFPCQDFSIAGKMRGIHSNVSHNGTKGLNMDSDINRGTMYKWMKEVIKITNPKIFYAENVDGLTKFKDVFEQIKSDFKNINKGFILLPVKVLNAVNYGVPQNRNRVIFIGLNTEFLTDEAIKAYSKDKISFDFDLYPPKTHYSEKEKLNNTLEKYQTCKDAFYKLEEPSITNDLSQKKYSKAKFIKNYQGNKEINLNKPSPTIRAEHHGNIEYRRLSKINGGIIENEYKLDERRLTIRECARIQTFPDNYEFVVEGEGKGRNISASASYKMIGNAVPPLLGFHIAMRLDLLWDKIFK